MTKVKTFTAKMQRPGQQPRFVPDCTLYQGIYIAQAAQVGRGKSWEDGGIGPGGDGDTWTVWERYEEILKPFFNGAKVTEEMRPALDNLETIQDVFAAGMEEYLLKFGVQDGYTITNRDEETRAAQAEHDRAVAEKKVPISVTPGYFGLRIGERLPADDWAKIKYLAEYHRGDESDLEWLDDQGHINVPPADVRGWYYESEVITMLTGLGYTVQYSGQTVTTPAEMQAIEHEERRQAEAHYARVKEIKAEAARWKASIVNLARAAGPCTKQEAEAAAALPTTRLLDMQGPDIYGGGAWLHVAGPDLYYVRNNGMDGDDWSRNNYDTGGAGAICYRLNGCAHLVADIRTWVDSLGQYSGYAE